MKNMDSNSEALQENKMAKKKNTTKDHLTQLIQKTNSLTYEASLKELDILLEKLQNDNVLVEDLQSYYLQANIYLRHCQNLLETIEQEVIELNIDQIIERKNS